MRWSTSVSGVRTPHPAAALIGSLSALLLASLVVSACTTAVAGRPTAAPDAPAAAASSFPVPSSAVSSSVKRRTTNMPAPGATLAPNESPLVQDVVDDECLLSAAQFSALAGQAVSISKQQVVDFGDHKQNSCYYFADQSVGPIGRVDVFGVKGATPGDAVKHNITKFSGHPIDAANGGFTAPTSKGGSELFVAGDKFLVDIEVNHGPTITDDQWRSAAGAAVQELEG